jgi:integrase
VTKRRGNNEGSIIYREDKKLWQGHFSLPNGKRKYKYGKTQKEVRVWIDEQRKLQNEGRLVLDDKATFGEFLKKWFEEVAKHNLRPTTLISHESLMRRHILPTLGGIKLTDLKPAHIQTLYSQKLEEGFAKKTVKYIHNIIHQALVHALKQGMVTRNVSEAVQLPSASKHRVDALSRAQVGLLLTALEGDRLYPYYVLLLSTGLRKGEGLALTLDDLDLEAATIRVNKTLNFIIGKGLVVGETKSERSRRKVALPEFAVEVLRRHLAGRDVQSQYVFATSAGTPFSPRNALRHFKKVLKKAGLPEKTRIHDLRHTFVTHMLAFGVPPKDVQEIVGHASFGTTMDIYGHLLDGAHAQAAKKMNQLFEDRTAVVQQIEK